MRRPARRLVPLTVAGVLLAGCDDGGTAAPTASPTLTVSAACEAPVEPPLQDGAHLLGDSEPPVPYSSTPATSGWHASGAPRTGVIPPDDPLSDPELVLTIEVGQVVAAYDPERVASDTVERLESLATTTYPDRLTVTPYEGAEAPLTFVAWGVLQSCDELDRDALDAFVAAHADPSTDAH